MVRKSAGIETVPVLAHLVHCMGEPWPIKQDASGLAVEEGETYPQNMWDFGRTERIPKNHRTETYLNYLSW